MHQEGMSDPLSFQISTRGADSKIYLVKDGVVGFKVGHEACPVAIKSSG